jgi:hypothetical protein
MLENCQKTGLAFLTQIVYNDLAESTTEFLR